MDSVQIHSLEVSAKEIISQSPFKHSTLTCPYLHHLIIVDTEEERHTVPLPLRPVHNAMNCRLIHPIRPPHQEISDINDETPLHSRRWNPCIIRTQDLQPRCRRAEQKSETLVVAMRTKSDFFILLVRVQGLRILRWRVVK
jgi:hypothetical protein